MMTYEEYLNEIEDFDDITKQELLADFQNHVPIDNPSMMQQMGYGGFQDFLKVKNEAQTMQLGETVRGMSNVSPLLQVRPANNSKTASFIKKSYFIDAQVEKKGNLTVINDLKKTVKDSYLYTSLDVFFDKNLNGVRDPDEKLMFTVYFFFSDDGNKVFEAYKTARLEESDIYFFIEGDEDFFSSKKLYAKVSPFVRKQFYNKDGEIDERFFNPSIMNSLSKNTALDTNIIKELLEKGYIEKDNVNLESILTTIKQGLLYFFSTSKGTGWICNKIGNGLDYLKISDDFWDTQSEDYFFDKDNLLKKVTIADDLINDIDKLFADKKGLDLHDITPNILEEYIKKYSNSIKKFIQYYNNFITQEIEAVYKLIDNETGDFLAGKMQMWIAYRCGLWNGIVDFISSLFKFVGGILESPFNNVQDFQGAMETLDNIYGFLFGGHFWANIGNAATEMYNKMLDFCKAHNKEDFDWVRVSYIAGSGIAFILSFFVPFTQVLKAAKLGKIAEIIEAVNKEVSATLSAAAKYGKDQAYKALSTLLELFSKGGKAFKTFLQQILNELEKWLLSARYKISKAKEFLGLGFSKETAETLGNLGLKPKLGFRQTGFGMSVPYGNFITRLEYKGVTVFEGSKKEVEALAKKLKNMGSEAAEKYLDELLIFKTAKSIAKNDLLDCSEIAEKILEEFKTGEIIELTPKEGRWMKGYENGVIDDWVYHQIYTNGDMVFDPWFSESSVSLSKYLEEMNKINPKGLNIKKIIP
ncbi:hypothetical protein B0E34_18070 [Chryseobacterium mucoviscidosis]|uniref:Uncharacterized protein n=2 Tax=Chryseobacterium mucoviscidosis TaxID=1945581 RepID=A0A202BT91_9FLAO|nr:hypothetical protein B0E34_18070 [Chryseobacterium mucoviscidosis]